MKVEILTPADLAPISIRTQWAIVGYTKKEKRKKNFCNSHLKFLFVCVPEYTVASLLNTMISFFFSTSQSIRKNGEVKLLYFEPG